MDLPNKTFSRRRFLGTIGLGAASLAVSGVASAADNTRLPNFIVIFTDDQGYQDMGCFGSPLIRTPNMDRMAREGIQFTDFYSACSVCSPSRAALLTGCYPPRVGITQVLFPGDTIGLNPKETTIADILKQKGYATAAIGKWHLGHLPEFLPRRQGFDYYFGIPYSNDMNIERDGKKGPPLMENEEIVEHPANQDTLTRRYTEHAIEFITANKDKPFFLYLPHTMPHIPLAASEQFRGKSERGLYGDAIEEIDWSVGQLLDALERLGMDKETFVFFTSDNGPWLSVGERGGCALPLRAGKFTTYEGGMRMPCVARWPGRIPEGTVCQEIASTIDLLPTLAGLAGAATPTDRVIDGKDIWPLLSAQPGARSPHDAFYYYKGTNLIAVREGKWKLHRTQEIELYDLGADISEKNNVAEANPEIVKRLGERMDRFDASLKANSRPFGGVPTPKKPKPKKQ